MRSPHFYYANLTLYIMWYMVYHNRCKEEVYDMKWFKEYNANPYGENIDDCVIRAVSTALDMNYWDVFDALCEYAGDNREPNQCNVFLPWLIKQGYEIREVTEKLTLSKFLNNLHQFDGVEDVNMLCMVNGHLTVIKNGYCLDTWDCGRYKLNFIIVKEGKY